MLVIEVLGVTPVGGVTPVPVIEVLGVTPVGGVTPVPVIEVLGVTPVGGVTPVPVRKVLGGTIVVDVLMSVDVIDCVLIDTETLIFTVKKF